MPRAKPYYYLVDKLTADKADILDRSLRTVADIAEVNISVGRSMIEVSAYRDVEAQVRLACDVAKVIYRTRARV